MRASFFPSCNGMVYATGGYHTKENTLKEDHPIYERCHGTFGVRRGAVRGVNRRLLSSVTQSRTAKIECDARPKYTENKRRAVKNSVTCRNSRKSERDEWGGGILSRKKDASRAMEFMNGPLCKTQVSYSPSFVFV